MDSGRLASDCEGIGVRVQVPIPSSAWPIEAESYHHFIADLCENIPEEWDDDVAAEAIILAYVRHLESLVRPEARVPDGGMVS